MKISIIFGGIILAILLGIIMYCLMHQEDNITYTINGYEFEIKADFKIEKEELNQDNTQVVYKISNLTNDTYIYLTLRQRESYGVTYGRKLNHEDGCIEVEYLGECLLIYNDNGEDAKGFIIVQKDTEKDPEYNIENNLVESEYYGIAYVEGKPLRDYNTGDYFPRKFQMLGFEIAYVSFNIPDQLYKKDFGEVKSELSDVIQNILKAKKVGPQLESDAIDKK